jgi:DNA-binding NarL/FixJ family response regulator
VRQNNLSTRVIILTMHEEESLFNEAMDVGVSGFVLKDHAVNDILDSLRAVDRGDVYLSPVVSNYLLRRSRRAADLRQQKPGLGQLTVMEKRVLIRVAENRTTKEIAQDLGVSPRTIETHRRNICQKLELTGSHRLLQFALKHKEAL